MPDLQQIKAYLKEHSCGGVALAFSGGVDSSLLLALLRQVREEAPFPLVALTMHSVFQREEELEGVKRAAESAGVELRLFQFAPLSLPELKNNPPDRCYWCKRHIFTEFTAFAKSRGIKTVMDGTNADDRKVYRPGRRALAELGILSPFAELGLTKVQVRILARELHLACAAKSASSCLATRFAYGAALTEAALQRVGKGEEWIRGFVPGAQDIRLRVHGGLARIEVTAVFLPEILSRRAEIAAGLKRLGFDYVTLDLEGYRSGSFDSPARLGNVDSTRNTI